MSWQYFPIKIPILVFVFRLEVLLEVINLLMQVYFLLKFFLMNYEALPKGFSTGFLVSDYKTNLLLLVNINLLLTRKVQLFHYWGLKKLLYWLADSITYRVLVAMFFSKVVIFQHYFLLIIDFKNLVQVISNLMNLPWHLIEYALFNVYLWLHVASWRRILTSRCQKGLMAMWLNLFFSLIGLELLAHTCQRPPCRTNRRNILAFST